MYVYTYESVCVYTGTVVLLIRYCLFLFILYYKHFILWALHIWQGTWTWT